MKRQASWVVALVAAIVVVGATARAETFVEHLQEQWEASRRQMIAIAEAVPEDKLNYSPTPEVRSFSGIILHVAGENLSWMEGVAGVAEPGEFDRFEHLKSRPEILKALTDYFDYGSEVLGRMTDQEAMEDVPFRRGRMTPRWSIVMQAIGHSKEHYGNLVTYLRLNGLVPPSSQ